MSDSRAEVLDTAGPSSARQPRQYGVALLPALAITVGVAVVIIGVAYAVLTSLIAIAAVAAVRVLGDTVSGVMWGFIGASI